MSISFKEDHISQIPALLMLENSATLISLPDEALALRGGSVANVVLESILRERIAAINVVQVSSTRTTVFSEQNITAGIEALRKYPDGRRIHGGFAYGIRPAYFRQDSRTDR